MSYPVAMITKRRQNPSFPGSEIGTIQCPLCHQNHEHGFNPANAKKDNRTVGHRSAHCCDPFASENQDLVDKGYILRLP